MCSLIFFVSWLLGACRPAAKTGITIRWQDKRAVALAIPSRLVEPRSTDSLDQHLSVRLADKETAIWGSFRQERDEIIFTPLIPFTRGLRYSLWLKNKLLSDITIPTLVADDKPVLLSVYPSQDTVPDNLLKIYLRFSRPMREGQSQQYVSFVKNGNDTLPAVFLNLQPELWNAERTLLTLWLDPGRIKRDLQPNKKLGAPLQSGSHYQVVVSGNWSDQQGATLGKYTSKSFVTKSRDSLSPVPARWQVKPPESGQLEPLDVAFGEALDYSLLAETLHVVTETGSPVTGKWQFGDKEKRALFSPNEAWKPGIYKLRIENRLEDLAGNNLNRPFDRDISRKDSPVSSRQFFYRLFMVR